MTTTLQNDLIIDKNIFTGLLKIQEGSKFNTFVNDSKCIDALDAFSGDFILQHFTNCRYDFTGGYLASNNNGNLVYDLSFLEKFFSGQLNFFIFLEANPNTTVADFLKFIGVTSPAAENSLSEILFFSVFRDFSKSTGINTNVVSQNKVLSLLTAEDYARIKKYIADIQPTRELLSYKHYNGSRFISLPMGTVVYDPLVKQHFARTSSGINYISSEIDTEDGKSIIKLIFNSEETCILLDFPGFSGSGFSKMFELISRFCSLLAKHYRSGVTYIGYKFGYNLSESLETNICRHGLLCNNAYGNKHTFTPIIKVKTSKLFIEEFLHTYRYTAGSFYFCPYSTRLLGSIFAATHRSLHLCVRDIAKFLENPAQVGTVDLQIASNDIYSYFIHMLPQSEDTVLKFDHNTSLDFLINTTNNIKHATSTQNFISVQQTYQSSSTIFDYVLRLFIEQVKVRNPLFGHIKLERLYCQISIH